MDVVSFISQSLSQAQQRLLGTCDGLTDEQAAWRPAPHANSIGFILWHVARAEDRVITRLQPAAPDLWEAQGWRMRFGQPAESPDPGDRPGLHALPIPGVDTLVAYLEAAYARTMEYVRTLTPNALDAAIDGERTCGAMLRHLVTHKNNHHGQIDYLRGLQDPGWDLPPGTGMVQR